MDFMVHLEDLSVDELQKLMENEDKINEFVLDDERLKQNKLDREMVRAENRSLAEDNLSKEPTIQQLKSELGSKYARLKDLHEKYETNRVKIASLSKDENLDSMLAVLQAKSAECEEKTESLAELLNTGQVEIGNFITEFKQVRKVSHLRSAKVDKMRELILEIRRGEVHNPTPYPAAPQPAPRGRHGSNPVVPTQPTNTAPYPAYPGYGHPTIHPSASYPQAHQPDPSQQQYPQYQW